MSATGVSNVGMIRRIATLIVLASVHAVAQGPTAFEVASIKPNRSGDFRRGIGPEPGSRFGAINVTLRDLVAFAYGISNSDAEALVIGGPEWIARERFDVAAKAAGAVELSAFGAMVKTMLAERFSLRAHDETRPIQVYALVRARADGPLGRQLRRSDVD